MTNPPSTGPERGEALKGIIRRNGLTIRQFAERAGTGEQTIHMLLNGGRTALGRDLAIRTTDDMARRIATAVVALEPTWANDRLWAALGIPADRQGAWTPDRAPDAHTQPGDATVEVDWTWGVIAIDQPVRLRVAQGERGLQVWRVGRAAAVLPEGEEMPRGELLGTLAGLELVGETR